MLSFLPSLLLSHQFIRSLDCIVALSSFGGFVRTWLPFFIILSVAVGLYYGLHKVGV